MIRSESMYQRSLLTLPIGARFGNQYKVSCRLAFWGTVKLVSMGADLFLKPPRMTLPLCRLDRYLFKLPEYAHTGPFCFPIQGEKNEKDYWKNGK
jgi:hypothetical protein